MGVPFTIGMGAMTDDEAVSSTGLGASVLSFREGRKNAEMLLLAVHADARAESSSPSERIYSNAAQDAVAMSSYIARVLGISHRPQIGALVAAPIAIDVVDQFWFATMDDPPNYSVGQIGPVIEISDRVAILVDCRESLLAAVSGVPNRAAAPLLTIWKMAKIDNATRLPE
jgi:hypothetical protein